MILLIVIIYQDPSVLDTSVLLEQILLIGLIGLLLSVQQDRVYSLV